MSFDYRTHVRNSKGTITKEQPYQKLVAGHRTWLKRGGQFFDESGRLILPEEYIKEGLVDAGLVTLPKAPEAKKKLEVVGPEVKAATKEPIQKVSKGFQKKED